MPRSVRRVPSLFASSLVGLTALALIIALSPASCTLNRSGKSDGNGGQGGSTSSITAAGGSTSSTMTGAGGCGTPTTEVCLNGLDDDCDGLVDCDDTDDCGDYECLPLPTDGTLVLPVNSLKECSGELMGVTRSDCSQCGCQVENPGTCTHIAHLYTSAGCGGKPNESIIITAGDNCTSANTTADNGQSVSVIAEPLGLEDATCADDGNAPLSERFLCALNTPGACSMGGHACAPEGQVRCVLLDGDVDCPAGYDEKEVLYDTRAAQCSCDCEVTEQDCPSTFPTHLHAFNNFSCPGGPPNKGDAVSDGACLNTPFPAVLSLDNHDKPLNALGATCEGLGDASMASDAQTLCCPP